MTYSLKQLKRHRNTIAYKVLKAIQAAPGGLTFTEIQKFAFANRRNAQNEPNRVMTSGWWAGALTGNERRPGILRTHCILGDDKRYRLVEQDLDMPFWRATPTYTLNKEKKLEKQSASLNNGKKCQACGERQTKRTESTLCC